MLQNNLSSGVQGHRQQIFHMHFRKCKALEVRGKKKKVSFNQIFPKYFNLVSLLLGLSIKFYSLG